MEKTRVKYQEVFYYINESGEVMPRLERLLDFDTHLYNIGNYFHTKEEAESVAKKFRAVLKGADVIEMPSEEEISIECEYSAHKMDIDDGETPNSGLYWRGWGDAIRWIKSKIVK